MRRVTQDALISIGAVAIVLLLLVSVDARVREQAVRVVSDAASGDVAGSPVDGLASIVMTAARDQSVAHAPLALFVVVGGVLLLAMLRT